MASSREDDIYTREETSIRHNEFSFHSISVLFTLHDFLLSQFCYFSLLVVLWNDDLNITMGKHSFCSELVKK